MTYATVNPATGETVQEFPTATDAGVRDVVQRSHRAFASWRGTPLEERAALMKKLAGLYRERKQELTALLTEEMGKPVRQAVGEVKLSAAIYRWYAEHGPALLEDQVLDAADAPGAESSVVRTLPIGPLLGIMPWNFPYYQVARFAAPNLMLGNTVLLKHAPICAKSALVMEQLFRDAGMPEGAYVNIFATNDQIADVIADPRVQGVSLTGSERAGAAVAEIAGRNLKKCVLELGGSDAMIILDSADVAKTAKIAAAARLGNAGQACNSPKRMLVAEDLYDDFVAGLTAVFAKTTPGDPLADDTRMGPLSSASALDGLIEQVNDAKDKGATVHTGGDRVDGPGSFMQPTVLTDVTPEMRAYTEELFGPVAMIYKISSPEEAIEFANSSPYGLSGSVWTQDAELGRSVADRLDVGMAFVNEHGTTMAELPFGGVKRSGYGRELASYGMDEFANKKLIRIR